MNQKKKKKETIFKNLEIIDGTGAPAYTGDIRIKDGRIAEIGKIENNSKTVCDCTGLVATPGFIDIHNHSDFSIFSEPAAKNFISQGVTTIVTGNCGMSAAPINDKNKELFEAEWMDASLEKLEKSSSFSGFLNELEQLDKSINIAPLIGHGNIRSAVMGMEGEKAKPEHLSEMQKILGQAMEAGCFGMSTGLIYDPGIHSDTEELISLTKKVAEYDGIYATHMRNESDLLIDSFMEAVTISRQSKVRTQISHLKTSGKRNFGLDEIVLKLMEYYRRFKIEITCDVYPCIYGHTGLENCLPVWSRKEGKEAFLNIIKQKHYQEKIRKELARPSVEWENILLDAGFEETIVSGSKKLCQYEGKSIKEIALMLKKDPYDTIFYLLLNDPDIAILVGGLGEKDMEMVLQHSLSMVCSDARVLKKNPEMCHPRNYRAFTKVLADYVREKGMLSLEKAIWKMTSFPAWKLGLSNRGLIKPGFFADLCIFDFWNLNYYSHYGDPHHYSKGMVYVMTNGQMIIEDGRFNGNAVGGKLLRKNVQNCHSM